MELRPYQAECIETIEAQPPGAFLAQMATGLGKTVTFANIPRHGERMLILSHREELVEQPRKYFNCSYGIERAKQHSHGEEVVSASIQTLARRLSDFDPEDFRLIICDEAHHAAASTYRKIFDYFRPEKLIGFTATPNRGDRVRLDTVFSKIIFQRDLRWGVKNGYLCDIHCRRVDIGFDITAVHTRQGDYAPGELDQAMDGTADAIAQAYRDMAVGATLIFAVSVHFTYLTEDADKVRAMLKDGPWGYGAPEPTVKQGFNLSRTRTEVRKNLSVLDALLRKRLNDLGYDPYWQRFMCQNWDLIKGCSAGCTDCDSCTEFRRIKPQYCRMCGGEFLERREQTFCPKCRAMRKKQAQKKYAVLHARGRL